MRRANARSTGAGELTEELTLLSPTPVAVAVSGITRVTTTATVTTGSAHGYTSGDFIVIAGADQAAYNGEVAITVTGASTFTYTVAGNPATPATGTISALFSSDSQGGQGSGWHTVATIFGAVVPLSASELLQAQAMNSEQAYRVTIYYRPDITPKMRLSWLPYQFTVAKTLEIHGVLPDADEPRRFLVLDVAEVI
jgi:SPP1 family predicted phage head-tail adaptor